MENHIIQLLWPFNPLLYVENITLHHIDLGLLNIAGHIAMTVAICVHISRKASRAKIS